MAKIRRVLISVTDKSGILDFARLLAQSGAELISTGGTARLIREAGIAVQDVSDVTGFPEMLDGRVKTLHPKIHGGILAIRENAAHMTAVGEHEITPIDMVVSNLYRFEEAAAKAGAQLEDLIENIDIGGPAMIRSAAKNHRDVAVVVSPADYDAILAELRANGGGLSPETHWRLAKKAFRTTADYDAAISARLEQVDSPGPLPLDLSLRTPKLMDLRYGENPHQLAALYGRRGAGIAGAEQLHGKELSYNNLVDLDAAYQLAVEFSMPRCPPWPSSSTPIPADAAWSRESLAKEGLPQGSGVRPGLGVRRRDRHQSARWMKRPRARSPNYLWRLSPRRIIRLKRWSS